MTTPSYGIDYMGPGTGKTPDRSAAGPAPGGDGPGSNIIGAWPGDLDGDELRIPSQDLLTDHLRTGAPETP